MGVIQGVTQTWDALADFLAKLQSKLSLSVQDCRCFHSKTTTISQNPYFVQMSKLLGEQEHSSSNVLYSIPFPSVSNEN
jgi:hypothetical protein